MRLYQAHRGCGLRRRNRGDQQLPARLHLGMPFARMSAWMDSRVPAASGTTMSRAAGDSTQACQHRPPSR